MPSAGILTPMMVTGGGGLFGGSSLQPKKDHIEVNMVEVGPSLHEMMALRVHEMMAMTRYTKMAMRSHMKMTRWMESAVIGNALSRSELG